MSSALQHYIRLHHLERAIEACPTADAASEVRIQSGWDPDMVLVSGAKPPSRQLRAKLRTGTESIMDHIKVTRQVDRRVHDAALDLDGIEDSNGGCRRCHMFNTFVLHTRTATQTCSNCGETVEYQDNDAQFMDAVWRDTNTTKQQSFSYKRSNHMLSWILRIQGKENSPITDDQLDRIRGEFDKMQLDHTDAQVVTIDRLRDVLKAVRLPKLYSHVHSMRHTLTGHAPPQMSETQEHAVMDMFKDVTRLYDIVQKRGRIQRSNMLSYSIVLSKILEALGYDQFLASLRLLKHRERLVEQESIWKAICAESANHDDLPTFASTQSPVF